MKGRTPERRRRSRSRRVAVGLNWMGDPVPQEQNNLGGRRLASAGGEVGGNGIPPSVVAVRGGGRAEVHRHAVADDGGFLDGGKAGWDGDPAGEMGSKHHPPRWRLLGRAGKGSEPQNNSIPAPCGGIPAINLMLHVLYQVNKGALGSPFNRQEALRGRFRSARSSRWHRLPRWLRSGRAFWPAARGCVPRPCLV
jgi:hypothetical protein